MGITEAQSKWERKTSGKGAKWKAHVTGKEAKYCKAVSDFIGAPAGGVCAEFARGVGAVSAEDFNRAITGKGPKWATNYKALGLSHAWLKGGHDGPIAG
jgi:hypothetical protein